MEVVLYKRFLQMIVKIPAAEGYSLIKTQDTWLVLFYLEKVAQSTQSKQSPGQRVGQLKICYVLQLRCR